jgi:hypothetical protein
MIEIKSVPPRSCAQGAGLPSEIMSRRWNDIVPTLAIAQHPLLTAARAAASPLAAAPAAYSASAASYRSQAARSAARSSRVMLGDFGGLPLLMKAPQRARLQERQDLGQQVR